MTSRRRLVQRIGGLALVAAAVLGAGEAQATDKVVLRTNWLLYGSHAIFFLGIDRGYYADEGIDVVVKQGNGSGNAVRLVANGDSDFAYGSASTMLNLAGQGAPVVSVMTVDGTGTDAVLINPDAGIKDFKGLEGQKVLTTAGAGVNTMFPVAAANAGADVDKIQLTNVAESALVQSYLQGLAPAMLGGMDDKPAEIKANGGKQPVILNYADFGVSQPGYAIVARTEMVKDNPDLVQRFVRATLKAVKAAKEDPDAAIQALINWSGSVEDQKAQAREVLDVTLGILTSPNNTDKVIGLNVPADWDSALEMLKKYKELKTDQPASAFYTNEFVLAAGK
ncbi:MAG: ABC transporter substrate-binding protein [Geminicoccaceae bacterium]